MSRFQIENCINNMIHEDDIKIRHFLQNHDMIPIIEEFLKNRSFLKERINVLSENPLWNSFMFILYENTIYNGIRNETIARILVLSEMIIKKEL